VQKSEFTAKGSCPAVCPALEERKGVNRVCHTGFVVGTGAFIFIGAAAVFAKLASAPGGDISLHVQFIEQAYRSNILLLGNFLYYLLVAAVALFSTSHFKLLASAILVLASATTAKFLITYYMCRRTLAVSLEPLTRHAELWVFTCTFMLLLAHSIPVTNPRGRMYIGYMPPNVWHNSTTIFLMPLALLLFWYSYRYLMKPSLKLLALCTLFLLLNIAAKPSYAFVFVLLFPCFSLIRFRFTRHFFGALSVVLLGITFIAIQYVLIYHINGVYAQGSRVIFRPLATWSMLTVHPPWPHVASLVFPALVAICYFAEIRRDLLYKYAAASFAVGYAISLLLAESGSRAAHGNFVWQAIIGNYLLFFVSAIFYLRRTCSGMKLRIPDKLAGAAFALHFISGVGYLVKIFLTGTYY
jgi:hypothetical protein